MIKTILMVVTICNLVTNVPGTYSSVADMPQSKCNVYRMEGFTDFSSCVSFRDELNKNLETNEFILDYKCYLAGFDK